MVWKFRFFFSALFFCFFSTEFQATDVSEDPNMQTIGNSPQAMAQKQQQHQR